MAAKKNFTEDIKKISSFEGQGVSQTYEEREAEKATAKGVKEKKMIKKFNKEGNISTSDVRDKSVVSEDAAKEKNERRFTLYLPDRLYNRLTVVSNAESESMNQLIISAIEATISETRAKAALNKIGTMKF